MIRDLYLIDIGSYRTVSRAQTLLPNIEERFAGQIAWENDSKSG